MGVLVPALFDIVLCAPWGHIGVLTPADLWDVNRSVRADFQKFSRCRANTLSPTITRETMGVGVLYSFLLTFSARYTWKTFSYKEPVVLSELKCLRVELCLRYRDIDVSKLKSDNLLAIKAVAGLAKQKTTPLGIYFFFLNVNTKTSGKEKSDEVRLLENFVAHVETTTVFQIF